MASFQLCYNVISLIMSFPLHYAIFITSHHNIIFNTLYHYIISAKLQVRLVKLISWGVESFIDLTDPPVQV